MTKRRLKPTEFDEQKAVFDWAELAQGMWPELALLFHCPNGGSRHPIEAKRLKMAGVKPGVPDVWLPVPRHGRHGCVIEMKSEKGRVTDEQHAWLLALDEQDYDCHICFSAQEAIEALTRYLQ